MDDFDDYIVDDIVLDDQTLAALDQQEKQYFAAGSSLKSNEPANKRMKTAEGWSPVSAIHKAPIFEDESLPEISLQGDGSYGLSAKLNLNPIHASYEARQGHHPTTLNNAQSTSKNIQAPPPRFSNLNSLPNPASSRLVQQQSRQSRSSSPHTISAAKHVGYIPTLLKTEAEQLRKALDEINQLRADYDRLQAKLQETQEARIMKEGEVGVLRRSIEKNNQMHASQLAQLKQEKEKAEAKQGEMQKEIKEEVERLRTQFMFKQQELEANIRKPPATLRAKRISKELPATPTVFGSTQVESSNGRRFPEATPVRFSRPPGASPTKLRALSPQKPAKAGTLPGFHNAFDTSTPIRSQIRRINKGKEKQNEDYNMGSSLMDIKPLYLSPASPRVPAPPELADDLALFPMPSMDSMADTPVQVDSDEEAIPDPPFEGINWKALMAHFLLTYSHPSSEIFIFQRLLSIAQPVNSALYISCCSEIMEVIANPIDVTNFTESLKVICSSLLTLFILLNKANELQLLASTMNLCTKLIFAIPGFISTITTSVARVGELDIMTILCKLVVDRLQPDNSHQDKIPLARESILLLESLVIKVSPEDSDRIKALPRNRECLMVLLHPSQPIWLLERAARLLCVLSCHHSMFYDILNISAPNAADGYPGLIKEALIDLLCSHLVDPVQPVRQDNKDLRIYILTFFTQLSVAHTDARTVLVWSHSLISCIIIYLTQLITPLWEDDERLMKSSEETTSLIRTTNQVILLLHNLIFDGPNAIDLRDRLQTIEKRFSHGIFHMFIVTLGRLSYCDPPSWVNGEGKQDLEHICELSRDILEIVVDGPEVDNVWAAFQVPNDDESMTDEEDMEAKLLGIDDNLC